MHVLPPPIFWRGGGLGGAPQFLDLHYKIQTASDYVAKFHGDRPRDLEEHMARKKTSQVKDLTCPELSFMAA